MHRDRVAADDAVKRQGRLRTIIQLAATVFFNGYVAGFFKADIFTGSTKGVCVPVLNCYSCPGALGACPIGSLQTLLGEGGGRIPFYVLGTLMLFGILFGRLLCGFLCPFGFIQDLLHKIPLKKVTVPKKIDKPLRWVKYAVLLILVIALPLFTAMKDGFTVPYFCEWICPAGTLEAGIPLVIADPSLRALTGALFDWKVVFLVLVLIGSVFVSRFFCRYLCPLGAVYSLFNRFALYRLELDEYKCVKCGRCNDACPMAVDVIKDINSPECIRCGKCKAVCPEGAIRNDCSFIRKGAGPNEDRI